ncbi:carotenoid-cleaving dioxygenase, mitochondrial-like [Glandiceps talaboti]
MGDKIDLRPFYETINDEHPEPIQANIRGEVPEWLKGSLYRNGPGLYDFGEDSYQHFFDGHALLHRYIIKDGKVTYQSRFLRSDSYLANMKANRIVVSGFGTVAHPDPCQKSFQSVSTEFKRDEKSDNCAVSYTTIGDELFVLTETNFMRKVNPETLETLDKVDISKFVVVNAATAHPHIGNDGTNYNMGSSFDKRTFYNIIKIETPDAGQPTLQKSSILCRIPAKGRDPSYYHSFCLTDNYIVYLEQPLHINVVKIMQAKINNTPLAECMEYRPENKAYFHVVNRHTGEVLPPQYCADAFFCYHHINGYEEDGHIVVDMCTYDKGEVIKYAYVSELKKGNAPASTAEVTRYILPLDVDQKNGTSNLVTLGDTECKARKLEDGSIHCTSEKIIDESLEAPTVNYKKYNGKPYQFAYGICGDNTGVMKVDFKNKSCKVWKEENYLASEPIFVPSPTAKSEDDGVVLASVVTGNPSKPNFLIILDGKDLKEIARAEVNVKVPFGIHGVYLAKI